MGCLELYHSKHTRIHKMIKVLSVLSCLVAVGLAAAAPRNELTCSLCTDIITDIDEFLTSETTENEIIAFVEQLCSALGQIIDGFEATCKFLVESQLPAIIEGLVNDNLKPEQICTDLLGESCIQHCYTID